MSDYPKNEAQNEVQNRGRQHPRYHRFDGRIVMLGFGSVGQAVLPLLLRHLDIRPEQVMAYGSSESKGSRRIAIDLGRLQPLSLDGEHHTAVDGRIFTGGEELPFRGETIDRTQMRAE